MSSKPAWLVDAEGKFKILEARESSSGEWEVYVDSRGIIQFLAYLRGLEQSAFVHLADLSAYDDHPSSPRFNVFYELISMDTAKRMRVVARVENDTKPELPSVYQLWKGASWLEREAYDMYGIIFTGHPDLRRMLLPPSFKGHPLRKDFVVDYRQEFEVSSQDEPVFDPFGSTVVQAEGDLK
ncbi:NADH-quinone oxidoreductase subunit C [bacterium]|nr:NADH-quinone oxidoreductase subunit C [bacterium]